MPIPLHTYKLNIYDLVWFALVLWHINPCRLFKTIVGYLMPNSLYTCILNIYDLICLGFYGISIIVVYLMPNRLYTYIRYI